MVSTPDLRLLGTSDLRVSSVALGCWPISGMTSLDVNERDSLETLAACRDCGINFVDTAYCYGANGESERLIGRALRGQRDEFVIATKGGIHWASDGSRVIDGRPETLQMECEASLQRLGTDHVDLMYLHAPDPQVPVRESAAGLKRLLEQGKARCVGVSNLSVQQMEQFAEVCPITACQPPYNLLQRQIERDIIPWCQARQVSVVAYWPLMKGLLAGKLPRDHQFLPADGRSKYPMFQGQEWDKNQDFVEAVHRLALRCQKTVAQIAVNWVIHQPGVTAALCGAKRAGQIRETAGAMGWTLSAELEQLLNDALHQRGVPVVRPPV